MKERTAIIRTLSNLKKMIFSCDYLDVSDTFWGNLGPNNLYNCPSSLAHGLLDTTKNTQK